MTNKEYLEKLSMEELVQTVYFDCPYSFIDRQDYSICKKNAMIEKLSDEQQTRDFIFDFVFGGKQREICNQCKVKWLEKEHK